MPLPTRIPLVKLKTEKELLRWANTFVNDLQNMVGDIQYPQTTMTLPNGPSNNLNTQSGTALVRVIGPTGAFSITGIAGGFVGKILIIHNTTVQNMTIANENAGSSIANRIKTMTGGDIVTTGEGNVTLIYSDTRWIVTAFQA